MSAAGLRRLGRRHRVVDVVRTVAEARAAGIGSVSLDLLYDVPDATLADWIDTLDAALALEPDHLSLYALTLDDPDAEGLTGPERRPPADDRRARVAGGRPRDRPRTRTAPRPSTTTPSIAWPRRLARLRDQQLGTARATRAATTSPTGSAGRTRRSARARTRSTA